MTGDEAYDSHRLRSRHDGGDPLGEGDGGTPPPWCDNDRHLERPTGSLGGNLLSHLGSLCYHSLLTLTEVHSDLLLPTADAPTPDLCLLFAGSLA